MTQLSTVRWFEAVSFQSFPAQSTYYNGTWAVRLTRNHTAKRLNSINALDPGDTHDLVERLKGVRAWFDKYEKPVVFRKTPLMPEVLGKLLIDEGWTEFDKTIIMSRKLKQRRKLPIIELEPQSDIANWVDTIIDLGEEKACNRDRMIQILSNTPFPLGLFRLDDDNGQAAAAVRTIVHGKLVGFFELATRSDLRRQGLATKLMKAGFSFGRAKGATTAWLQVVEDNQAAVQLYRNAGFTEEYHYSYWSPPHA